MKGKILVFLVVNLVLVSNEIRSVVMTGLIFFV
mgnify:FL=1